MATPGAKRIRRGFLVFWLACALPALFAAAPAAAQSITVFAAASLKDALDEIGCFDPVYTAAGDDVDVCWKLLDRGYEIAFSPAAQVLHQVHLDAEGDRRNVRRRRLLGGCDGQGGRHGQSRPAPAMGHWPHHSAPAGGTIRRKGRHAGAVSGAGAPE